METKAIFCDTCQICIVNNDGITVRGALCLIKDKLQIHICLDCCQDNREQSFEENGFIESGHKIASYNTYSK